MNQILLLTCCPAKPWAAVHKELAECKISFSWSTHEPHAKFSDGKKGYAIALRTGPNMRECSRIIESIEHFYGHLEIECYGSLGLRCVEYREAVEARKHEIVDFSKKTIT